MIGRDLGYAVNGGRRPEVLSGMKNRGRNHRQRRLQESGGVVGLFFFFLIGSRSFWDEDRVKG